MFRRLNNLGVSLKLVVLSALLLLTVVGVNYTMVVRDYAKNSLEALTEDGLRFTAAAMTAKESTSAAIESKTIDLEALMEAEAASISSGKRHSETRTFNTTPERVGFALGTKAAEAVEGLEFFMVATNARNKQFEPEPGSFRERMLKDLEAQVRAGGFMTLTRVNEQTNTLHSMRALMVDANCLSCHGRPGGEHDVNKTGKDMFGFAMEGWNAGEMRGAYEAQMSLDEMDADVAGLIKKGLLVTGGMATLALMGFTWLTRKTMLIPLKHCAEVLSSIAKGDLTVEAIDLQREDEIGVLARGVDEMAVSLRSLVHDTQRTSSEVASAATEIAATSEQMAAGMQQQSAQTSEVSAGVTEMAASVQEVADKSGRGRDVMEQMIREMTQIASEVTSAADAIGDLGRKSEAIGQIVSVINDIADQTNLLALNAAIEAARAGEHGRGFAVVADEVRKLAERTTTATKEIAASIRGIQQETSAVVEQMESGTKRVSEGVNLAKAAGESLAEIVAATHEQASASEQISRNMERISAVTRESTDGASQAASAASQLSVAAEQLQALVGRFRI